MCYFRASYLQSKEKDGESWKFHGLDTKSRRGPSPMLFGQGRKLFGLRSCFFFALVVCSVNA